MENNWREYEHLTELYKSYLNIMVTLGVFSFAGIGGVTSFILKDEDLGIEKYGIFMPLFFSFGLAVLYSVSIKPACELRDTLEELGKNRLRVVLVPHAYLLIYGCFLLAILYSLISIGLSVVACSILNA